MYKWSFVGICNPGSCILWIFNPVKHPELKRICLTRITDPYNTYSWDNISQQPIQPFAHLKKSISMGTGYLTNLYSSEKIKLFPIFSINQSLHNIDQSHPISIPAVVPSFYQDAIHLMSYCKINVCFCIFSCCTMFRAL